MLSSFIFEILVVSSILFANFAKGSTGGTYVVPPTGTISVFSELDNTELLEVPVQSAAFKMGYTMQGELKGYIVKSIGENGCQSFLIPSRKPSLNCDEVEDMGRIVILNNLGCSYNRKVENAKEAGFIAVIIYNDGSNETELIGLDGKKLVEMEIPTFSIGSFNGVLLRDRFNEEMGFYIKIYTPLSVYQLIMLVIIWTGFTAIIIVFAAALFRTLLPRMIRPISRRFLTRMKIQSLRKSLQSLPLLKWSPDLTSKYETCVVCLENFTETDDTIRVLKCSHCFHEICLEKWFIMSRLTCPLCSAKFEYSSIWGQLVNRLGDPVLELEEAEVQLSALAER